MGRKLQCAIAVTAAWLVAGIAVTAQNKTARNAGADAALQEFNTRVNQYLQFRKDKAGSLPGPTTSASKITDTREGIRARILANRGAAKQGDIFTKTVAAYFHRQIASAFHGARGNRVLASLQHAEPLNEVHVNVNQPYPDGVPLQSMPPTLLLKLPKLPKELQYRIVGRNLVLLDTEPNLVVDLLPDAIPATSNHA